MIWYTNTLQQDFPHRVNYHIHVLTYLSHPLFFGKNILVLLFQQISESKLLKLWFDGPCPTLPQSEEWIISTSDVEKEQLNLCNDNVKIFQKFS